jgi:hypothetical protein
MDELDKQKFYDKALDKVYFYLESNFWSQPDASRLETWLNNFKTTDEKYCAARLLDRFVYYSEEDTERLLKCGLYEKILKQEVVLNEKENAFSATNSEINELIKNELDKTLFFPLSTGNISESSQAMARQLTHRLGIDEKNIIDVNNLTWEQLKNKKRIIIVDDFIGTGTQIINFWNYKKVSVEGKEYTLCEIKNELANVTTLEYLCLVTTEHGFQEFYNPEGFHDKGLKITYGEILGEKFKVFGEKSTYFNQNEIIECKRVLTELCEKNGINLLGYKTLGYAIAFHHGIPDASLPLFYKETDSWCHLHKNKETKYGVYV